MNFDFINVMTIIAAVISAIIAFRTIKEIISDRKHRKKTAEIIDESVEDSEYKRIKASTYWLEHERQPNKGNHYEDESVYLNRASVIREKTSFFSFIND